MTHLRLKAMCLTDKQCFNTRAYTKKKIIDMFKVYGVKATMNDTKKILSEKPSDVILQCNQITPESKSSDHVVDNEMPSTSNTLPNHEDEVEDKTSASSHKRKCSSSRKGKGKKKKSSSVSVCIEPTIPICSVCMDELGDSSDLIACDLCDKWLHRQCADILREDDWTRYKNGLSYFFCTFCKQ